MFKPKFQLVSSVYECADMINQPHEDYPERVPSTKECILDLLELNEMSVPRLEYIDAQYPIVTEHTVRTIHSVIMGDLPSDVGMWRTVNVQVGSDIPPDWIQVPDLIKDVLPTCRHSFAPRFFAAHWYAKFQEIHPFRDGNGRVGGVVLAYLTHDSDTGTMLAPCQ